MKARLNKNTIRRFTAALLFIITLCALGGGCVAKTTETKAEEPETALYVLDVGKGDTLLIKTGGKTYLIDAGKQVRWGRVYSLLNTLGVKRLDAVFLTHTDKDHAGGLMPLALSDMEIGAWYASAYFCEPKKESKHPAVLAAAVRGQSVRFLEAGDTAEEIFEVLAPFGLNETNEDDNSLVMRAVLGGVSVLLTGDMEYDEEEELTESGADILATVLKVPNHGDDDACSTEFLSKVKPKIAIISTDPEEKPGTPDELLLEALEEAGAEVLRTDLCAGVIRLAFAEGKTETAEFALPAAADVSGAEVTVSDAKTEKITLYNTGKTILDLTGCYLISENKEEIYLFPAGTAVSPEEALTVGTLSTGGKTDLTWNAENVFSNKKEDGLTLFDAGGTPVCGCLLNEE